jgi:hypothetical protein
MKQITRRITHAHNQAGGLPLAGDEVTSYTTRSFRINLHLYPGVLNRRGLHMPLVSD